MYSRTSISVSWSGPFGEDGDRFAHSIASASDFTWISQYPPTSSFVSANGPSITVFFPPAENRTRAPLELGYRPAASSRIPALLPPAGNPNRPALGTGDRPAATNRIPAFGLPWVYFTIAAIDSSLGIL